MSPDATTFRRRGNATLASLARDSLLPAPHASVLLRQLRDAGPLSRAALATATDLSPSTISKTVTTLIEEGWVRESDPSPDSGVGRPAVLLHLVPGAGRVAAIDIGHGLVRLGVADSMAALEYSTSFETSVGEGPENVLDNIVRMIHSSEWPVDKWPLAVGVAVPGPVDGAHRVNLVSVGLGWQDVHIADYLERELGVPVIVEANVRAMAHAEVVYGGHGVADLAYVYLGTGVGLGLVVDGTPFYPGAHGVSELGHCRFTDAGTGDGDHRGHLNAAVGERRVLQAINATLGTNLATAAAAMTELEAAAYAGSEPASRLLDQILEPLSRAIATVANLFGPEIVLLGGYMASASDTLFEAVGKRVSNNMFPLPHTELQVARPRIAQPRLVGAAAAALEHVIYR